MHFLPEPKVRHICRRIIIKINTEIAKMNTNKKQAEIINLRTSIEYQSNSVVSRVLLKNENGNITIFAFDKGEELSEHTAQFDAHVQIIEGEAEISISRIPYKLKEGDSIIMPAGKPHALKATDKYKMILTMIRPPISG
jgi:quercetin dioxygenase-like cupin family protein